MNKKLFTSIFTAFLIGCFSISSAQEINADLEMLPGNEMFETVPNGGTYRIKAQIVNHGPDDIPEDVYIFFNISNSAFPGWGLPTGLNVGDSTEVMGLVSNINNNAETDTLEMCVELIYSSELNEINDPNPDNDIACNYLILEGESVSIHENNKENSIVFPNPFNEKLYIELKEWNFQNAHIIIYDILGKEIHRESIKNQEKIEIQTANWNKGMYFIEMQGLNERINWKVLKE
ncbi:MAG TPA: T9SS type A sorting domain-containing protein [Chitinophagaceae bacterium]|nr:T9SS type A sorting domain-containing protein [Chitinophagaceae bacterium]